MDVVAGVAGVPSTCIFRRPGTLYPRHPSLPSGPVLMRHVDCQNIQPQYLAEGAGRIRCLIGQGHLEELLESSRLCSRDCFRAVVDVWQSVGVA